MAYAHKIYHGVEVLPRALAESGDPYALQTLLLIDTAKLYIVRRSLS